MTHVALRAPFGNHRAISCCLIASVPSYSHCLTFTLVPLIEHISEESKAKGPNRKPAGGGGAESSLPPALCCGPHYRHAHWSLTYPVQDALMTQLIPHEYDRGGSKLRHCPHFSKALNWNLSQLGPLKMPRPQLQEEGVNFMALIKFQIGYCCFPK